MIAIACSRLDSCPEIKKQKAEKIFWNIKNSSNAVKRIVLY